MKKFITSALAAMLVASTALVSACSLYEGSPSESLSSSLTESVKTYFASGKFDEEMLSAVSNQARLPLLYAKYVDGDVYGEEAVNQLETYMSYIDEVIGKDGKIDDTLFDSAEDLSEKNEWGGYAKWYSVLDYTFTFSLIYNQYKQAKGNAETKYDEYAELIIEYVAETDTAWGKDGKEISLNQWSTFDVWNLLPIIANDFGKSGITPYSDAKMISYYDKDENGKFINAAYDENVGPNWVGFTGRPLAASLYTNDKAYDPIYEKTMQPYYPLYDNYVYPIEFGRYVTLDTLYDNYDVDLGEWSTHNPQYAILTAMAHGTDVENYTDAAGKKYDLIARWLESLDKDDDGQYVLNTSADAALAIAYVAKAKGIEKPTPIGAYNANMAVIKIEK